MDILKSDISQTKKYIKTIKDNKEWLKISQNDKEGKKTTKKIKEKRKPNRKENMRIKGNKNCTMKFYNSLPKYKRIEIKSRFSTRNNRWLSIKLTELSRNPYVGGRRNNTNRLWNHISEW